MVDTPSADPGRWGCDCLRRASWIWPTVAYAPLRNVYADFARDFTPDAPAERPTRLHVTADAAYVLWVNGHYVGRGPARGWQASWPFDSYDVSPLLRRGPNRIAVRVHNPGRSTFRYVHENGAGLLLATEGGVEIVSDERWQCRISPSRRRATPRLTIQLEDQEHADLGRDETKWRLAETDLADDPALPPADAVVDSDGTLGRELRWNAPRQARAFGSPPWHAVEPRGLPLLTNLRREYELVARGVVPDPPGGGGASFNPAIDLFDVLDQALWQPATGGSSTSLAAADAGSRRVAIFDIGEATLGSILLRVAGGRRGATLDLIAFEACEFDAAGRIARPILPDPRGECRVGMALRLTLGDEPADFESFHAYGGRYLAVVLHGPCEAIIVAPGIRETLYPLADEGLFTSSDAQLDATRAACARTQRVNMTDAYIDAWREQAQWWGDARVQFANHQHLAIDDRLLRRGVRQIAAQRTPNGLTYGHAPTAAHTCVLPDFSLTWLLTLHDHWWQTGSPELAVTHRADAERVLAYFDGEGRGGGRLLRYDPRYWLFLDWADIPKQGSPTLLNLWYVHALRRLSSVYRHAGETELGDALHAAAGHHSKITQMLLFDGGLWRDGLDESNRPRETCGTHAQALAVLAGFDATPQMRDRIAAAVDLREPDPREPSCFWITYVFEAAGRLGLGEKVLDCVRERWRPMVKQGSTFEVWQPTPAESRSHAWSAHPLHHLPRLAVGVAQSAAGWAEVDFAPPLGVAGLSHARTIVPTPRGPIAAAWRRDGDGFDVRLDLPDDVRARVHLGDGPARETRGGRRWRVSADEAFPGVTEAT